MKYRYIQWRGTADPSVDQTICESVFESILSMLCRSGYQLVIRNITSEFLDFQIWADKKKYSNPELDPTLHDLDEHNSFWIEIKDQLNKTIGTVSGRLCNIGCFLSLCRYYEFWYGDKIRFREPLNIVYEDFDRIPSGRSVYDGAMWIRPDHRNRGLSWALSRLCRLTAMRMWQPEWIFGFGFEAVTRAGLPKAVYGYRRHGRFATGFKFPGHPSQSIFLATMTAGEVMRSAAEDRLYLASRPGLLLDEAFANELRELRQRPDDERKTAAA